MNGKRKSFLSLWLSMRRNKQHQRQAIDSNFRRFSFVRTDQPDHSRRNENFFFNQLSNQISQIPKRMHQGDGSSAKTLGKSLFHFQTDWSGNGRGGQFWQVKSALTIFNFTISGRGRGIP